MVLASYKGKGDRMECGSYRWIRFLEHAVKMVERVFEHRIRQQIEIDDMHCGFLQTPSFKNKKDWVKNALILKWKM